MPFLGRVDVDVHVDEAGDEELAAPVDQCGADGGPCRPGGPDLDDPVPFDQDGDALPRGMTNPVDDFGIDNRQSVDFAHGRNINLVDMLFDAPRLLPTGLSTAVHNLHVAGVTPPPTGSFSV